MEDSKFTDSFSTYEGNSALYGGIIAGESVTMEMRSCSMKLSTAQTGGFIILIEDSMGIFDSISADSGYAVIGGFMSLTVLNSAGSMDKTITISNSILANFVGTAMGGVFNLNNA